MRVRQVRTGGGLAALLLAGTLAEARPRTVPVLPPVDVGRLLMMDTAVTLDSGRSATRLGVPRTDPPSVLTPSRIVADDDVEDDDLRDRSVPYLQVDAAALAGHDDNTDQDDDEDRTGSAIYGVEARIAAGVGSDRAKVALAAEGSLVQTPSVPELSRYSAEAELEARAAVTTGLAVTGKAGISRFALTDPAERMDYGAAGLELGDAATGRLSAGVGVEQRRYRAAIAGDAEADGDSGAVRDTSDNAELRRLDYRRSGIDLAAELLGDRFVRPYALASAYRIRFPNPSDEIGDRAAIDLAAELGVELAFADDAALKLGGRYNRRDFRDPTQATIARLTPTASLELSRGDWLDLSAGYRRAFVQPEVTDGIARDAGVFELEAVIRPGRRWGLFLDAGYEHGRELRADAYDRELELTGRIEFLVLPRIQLLLEAYRDQYRFYDGDELDFAYDRTVLRGGVKTRF